MDGTFDLWDIESGNMIGTFESESEALAIVRDLVAANGTGYAEALDLGWIDSSGHSRSIATGSALLARAHAPESALSQPDRGRGLA